PSLRLAPPRASDPPPPNAGRTGFERWRGESLLDSLIWRRLGFELLQRTFGIPADVVFALRRFFERRDNHFSLFLESYQSLRGGGGDQSAGALKAFDEGGHSGRRFRAQISQQQGCSPGDLVIRVFQNTDNDPNHFRSSG